jgi:ubiquitin carboxyl-terminal hydrolase 14
VQVVKHSEALQRQATFNVTAHISRLPPYLAVQFVRFYWRKDTKKKAKICRNVYFPTVLDLLPYCTEEVSPTP